MKTPTLIGLGLASTLALAAAGAFAHGVETQKAEIHGGIDNVAGMSLQLGQVEKTAHRQARQLGAHEAEVQKPDAEFQRPEIEKLETQKPERAETQKAERVERVEVHKLERVERVERPEIQKVERVERVDVQKPERVEIVKVERAQRGR